MDKKMTRREATIVLLCTVIYFVSYITRINYAAVLVEFVKSLCIDPQIHL